MWCEEWVKKKEKEAAACVTVKGHDGLYSTMAYPIQAKKDSSKCAPLFFFELAGGGAPARATLTPRKRDKTVKASSNLGNQKEESLKTGKGVRLQLAQGGHRPPGVWLL